METLGLDAVAQAVYTAMLGDPEAGVDSLVSILGVEESQVRTALDQLAKLALLRQSREQPDRLVPVPPEVGLQLLIRRQEEELATRGWAIEQTRAAAERIVVERTERQAAEIGSGDTEHLTNLDAIQDRLDAMVAGAGTEVLSLIPGSAVPAETLEAAKTADAVILGRGVNCRIVYQDAIRNHPPTLAYGQWLTENGAQVRTTPVLAQRLLIVDRSAAALPLDPDDPWAGRVHTTNPGLVHQLITLFEQTWAAATPLAEPRPMENATGLTSMERALLQMLAAGSTDDAAAKRLGVSGRTVRRIMAELMERLDAESRFEAGIMAAKRGWL
ncbi:helix-turn-helix transcriptional regulator [Catenulispora subtropica]|uniref:LuxR family transcriptional regulator n=1 Tax=Catenulispora subtropica TaxID=450798 RepID=A0ABP5D251_9ACTN